MKITKLAMNKILIISHDPLIGKLFLSLSEEYMVQISTVSDLKNGVSTIEKGLCDAVVVSVPLNSEKCPRIILRCIQEVNENIPVYFLMNQLDVNEAIQLTKLGAEFCYSRPFACESVLENIQNTLEGRKQVVNRRKVDKTPQYLKVGSAPARKLYEQIDLVADTNFKVIIYGETGTGKESVARRLCNGIYKNRPFVAVDCGSLNKELAASELFGHKKGSFSGAFEDKVGAFEEANNGTIFLDEIGNLDYSVQMLLLRAIEEGKIRRVGSNSEIDIQVRIIVASNERLFDAVERGTFREDLYYRLNEFEISIPPLRERKEDIEPFIDFFIKETNEELGKNIKGVDPDLLAKFMRYDWPGNLRELKNVVRRGCLMTNSLIDSSCMSQEFRGKLKQGSLALSQDEKLSLLGASEGLKFKSIMAEYEEIMKILKEENYSKVKAAQRLNINRKTLYNKINAAKRFMDSGN
jgi:two-component system response regulator HydG